MTDQESKPLSAGSIQQLPSSLLAKILAYLPFKDRYLACIVCSQWNKASRVPWTDVTSLNLNSIPRAMADPILSLCPKLVSIEASDHTIVLEKKKTSLVTESVRTVKFLNVMFAVKGLSPLIAAGYVEWLVSSSATDLSVTDLMGKYFERFPKLSELTLRDCKATYSSPPKLPPVSAEPDEDAGLRASTAIFALSNLVGNQMAVSLKHVVLVRTGTVVGGGGICFDFPLERLQNLECAYLDGFVIPGACGCDLLWLRELCLVNCYRVLIDLAEQIGRGKFLGLQVLVYASDSCVDPDCLTQLITTKMALRILVIVGNDAVLSTEHYMQQHGLGHLNEVQYPIVLPPPQFPSDAAASNQSHTPPLQIFVGGDFTKHVRFTLPKSELANFWRVDCPMPEYLAKPEVAEVFKDVWLAKIIREGTDNGLLPWGHPNETHLFYSTWPLLFC